MNEKFDYLRLEYETGYNAINTWINARYQMFQMASYLNLGALTFGFELNLFFSPEQKIAGILISFICLLVTLIGLATEIGNRQFNSAYFKVLFEVEKELGHIDGKPILTETGIFSSARKVENKGFFANILVVDRLHIIFYAVLDILWFISLVYHLVFL